MIENLLSGIALLIVATISLTTGEFSTIWAFLCIYFRLLAIQRAIENQENK